MTGLDAELLARIQFALNISFHILFPSISIGLAWVLLYFRLQYTRSTQVVWQQAYQFWVKVFALTFALGVVSGITMSFQFGTNWPGFMERVGNIAGPLLGYEVLSAFFLEASFLGVMLFGRDRVSNRVHLGATFLVAGGTTLSGFWILSLDSWMQTPAGYRIEDGIFFVESWWEVIFNPSFPFRFWHMMLACLLTTAFLIAGVSAWQLLAGVGRDMSQKVLRVGIVLAAVVAPLQIFVGDLHGLNTLHHQPQKVAAMEAVWETQSEVPFTLFAIPDESTRSNHLAIEIPYAASLILTHSLDGEIRGLNDFDDHPPVLPVFFAFRVMLAMGMLMLATALVGVWQLFFRSAPPATWFLRIVAATTFSGWVAVLAGWYVTEVGRQPWIVHGLVKVSEVVAPHGAGTVLATLLGYAALYAFLMVSYIGALRYMAIHKLRGDSDGL